MIKVYFTYFGYFAQDTFADMPAALVYARSKGFDVTFQGPAGVVGTWSVIGGFRDVR